MNPRLHYLDALRGLAIIMVATGHAIQYTDFDFDNSVLFRFIYALHMPLFMFLSGYVTRRPKQEDVNQSRAFWSRVGNLLIPYMAWLPVGYACAVFLQQPLGYAGSFGNFLAQVPTSPDLGLWFLLILAECHFLLLLCSRLGERWLPWAGILVLVILNGLVIAAPAARGFGINLLRWYFLFFLLGHLLRDKANFPLRPLTSFISLVVFCLLASFWYRKSAVPIDALLSSSSGLVRQLLTQAYHFMTAITGIFGLFGLFSAASKDNEQSGTQKVLEYLGTRSLQIYAGHYVFLHLTIMALQSATLPATLRITIATVFAIAGALLLARMVRPVPFLNQLLYGNHNSKVSKKSRMILWKLRDKAT